MEITEQQYRKIGELLSIAIINKEHMHPADMRRSALLIYNIIDEKFSFHEQDLEKAIEISGEEYSDSIYEYLHQMVNVLNDLKEGQRNYDGEHYKLHKE
jgi:hypothetical protein